MAAVNLTIYDGISWAGGIPTLGPEVFDYAAATTNLIGVTSSAINTIDVSAFDIQITSGKLVVAWWMDTNPNGSCAQGHPANFATDYPTGNANCNVTQKNLLYILGQGWRDAATATVQGSLTDGTVVTAPGLVGIVGPPVAGAQSVTTNEDQAKLITLTASDTDSAALTFAIATPPTRGGRRPIGTVSE